MLKPKIKLIPIPLRKTNRVSTASKLVETINWPPSLIQKGSCYFWELPNNMNEINNDVYVFDLDETLIKTLSGHSFAKDKYDWQFWRPSVPTKLQEYLKNGSSIIIITNQKGVSTGKIDLTDIIAKVTAVIESICGSSIAYRHQFSLYIATEGDRYRKPFTGIWDLLPISIAKRVKYYSGDAAGRPADHSNSDLYFAQNIGKVFHTPDEIFLNEPAPQSHLIRVYPAQEYIDMPKYSTDSYEKNLNILKERLLELENTVCIMVGAQASGKSSLSRTLVSILSNQKAVHIEKDALGGVQKRFMAKIELSLLNKNIKWIFADATHPNHESRLEIFDLINKASWNVIMIHIETPLELTQHFDACRVQLELSTKLIPIVVLRTFYKRFRDDILKRNEEITANRWITFTGVSPILAILPEYKFCY